MGATKFSAPMAAERYRLQSDRLGSHRGVLLPTFILPNGVINGKKNTIFIISCFQSLRVIIP